MTQTALWWRSAERADASLQTLFATTSSNKVTAFRGNASATLNLKEDATSSELTHTVPLNQRDVAR